MDYAGKPQLWERTYSTEKKLELSRSNEDTIKQEIEKISSLLGTDKTIIYENNTLTIIKVSDTFDEDNNKPYRKIVRTETIPAKELPRSLLTLLEKKGFKRIV